MKRLLFFLFCAITALAQTPAWKGPETLTVIRAGRLIDGTGGAAKTNQVVVIRGNKIEQVRDAAGFTAPAGAQVIDLGNATLLPGLIDTHTHVFLQGYDPAHGTYDDQLLKHPISFRSARAVMAARRAVEQGFTTIRDLETEGAGYGDVGLRMAIDRGYVPGPRMYVVTRAISTTGGYPLHDYSPEVEVPKGVQIADGPEEMRKAAREQMENGADWVKVYMTHRAWLDDKGNMVSQPTLSVEEIAALADEVHNWGRNLACHAYGGVGLHRAIDGGCDSIEHGLDLDDAAVRKMVQKGIWYVPTMTVYYPDAWVKEQTPLQRKRVELHGPSFNRAVKAGVKIAFGTDAGGFDWAGAMAREFGYMVQFGMTPAQAIHAATGRAAELLGMEGKLGVIAPGAFADVVAVEADPLTDVKALLNVGFVMKDGRVSKNELGP